MFVPTLVAIAFKLGIGPARIRAASLAESKTYKRLGYDPITLDDGLRRTAEWLVDTGSVQRPLSLNRPLRRRADRYGRTSTNRRCRVASSHCEPEL